MGEAGREETEPRRARDLGIVGEQPRADGVRAAALHRDVGGPRRVHQHRWIHEGFGEVEGWGWYQRDTNVHGALLPQQITEFTNSGVACGLASVNLAEDPFAEFNGFWGACSTYGAFSYLKYGEMRLFSQLAQDSELQVGKVLWIAGHSGPETAEDSRTHFGIFETGVTQLFPDGAVIDLHPWEYNEVPVVLGAGAAPEGADRRAASHAAERRHPGSEGARHGLALRRRARRVLHPPLIAPGSRGWGPSSCRAHPRQPTS